MLIPPSKKSYKISELKERGLDSLSLFLQDVPAMLGGGQLQSLKRLEATVLAHRQGSETNQSLYR